MTFKSSCNTVIQMDFEGNGKMSLRKTLLSICFAISAVSPALSQPIVPQSASRAPVVAAGFMDRPEARFCDDKRVLKTIVARFRHQVRNVPHLPDVDIVDFHRVHQHRNYVAKEKWPIARRYCGATAQLSDGRKREVWYLIEEGMGLASIGDNVEFCVSGFDRWFVYNGRCRVLR